MDSLYFDRLLSVVGSALLRSSYEYLAYCLSFKLISSPRSSISNPTLSLLYTSLPRSPSARPPDLEASYHTLRTRHYIAWLVLASNPNPSRRISNFKSCWVSPPPYLTLLLPCAVPCWIILLVLACLLCRYGTWINYYNRSGVDSSGSSVL